MTLFGSRVRAFTFVELLVVVLVCAQGVASTEDKPVPPPYPTAKSKISIISPTANPRPKFHPGEVVEVVCVIKAGENEKRGRWLPKALLKRGIVTLDSFRANPVDKGLPAPANIDDVEYAASFKCPKEPGRYRFVTSVRVIPKQQRVENSPEIEWLVESPAIEFDVVKGSIKK